MFETHPQIIILLVSLATASACSFGRSGSLEFPEGEGAGEHRDSAAHEARTGSGDGDAVAATGELSNPCTPDSEGATAKFVGDEWGKTRSFGTVTNGCMGADLTVSITRQSPRAQTVTFDLELCNICDHPITMLHVPQPYLDPFRASADTAPPWLMMSSSPGGLPAYMPACNTLKGVEFARFVFTNPTTAMVLEPGARAAFSAQSSPERLGHGSPDHPLARSTPYWEDPVDYSAPLRGVVAFPAAQMGALSGGEVTVTPSLAALCESTGNGPTNLVGGRVDAWPEDYSVFDFGELSLPDTVTSSFDL